MPTTTEAASNVPLVGGVITAVGGVVVAVIAKLQPKQGRKIDYAERLVGASVGLVDQLQEQVTDLRNELREFEVRSVECERRYDRLVAWLASQGLMVPDIKE